MCTLVTLFTKEYAVFEWRKLCAFIDQKLVEKSSGKLTLESWGPSGSRIPEKSAPPNVYNWPSFKLGVALILQLSNQKFRSCIFHLKWPSWCIFVQAWVPNTPAWKVRLSPAVRYYISRRHPAISRTTKIPPNVPNVTFCLVSKIGAKLPFWMCLIST